MDRIKVKIDRIESKIIDIDSLNLRSIDEVYELINKKLNVEKSKVFIIKTKSNKLDFSSLTLKLRENKINYIFEQEIQYLHIFQGKSGYSFVSRNSSPFLLKNTNLAYLQGEEMGKIEAINVRYLFGYIKYDLKFDDRIFVITAPNGYGKSTLLSAINKFETFDHSFSCPFCEMTIKFENSSSTIYNENEGHFMFQKLRLGGGHVELFYKALSYDIFDKIRDVFYEIRYFFDVIHDYDFNYFNDASIEFQLNEDSIKELEDKINLYNKIMKRFIGEEKIITLVNSMEDIFDRFLKKQWINGNDVIYNIKNNLEIINKIRPLKCNENILKENEKIDFELLSSGEKYICYLFARIIFSFSPIIVIDEPELNLHIEWQQLLVEAINEIKEFLLKKYNFDLTVIISTHSPYIVNSPYVKVGGPEYEEE